MVMWSVTLTKGSGSELLRQITKTVETRPSFLDLKWSPKIELLNPLKDDSVPGVLYDGHVRYDDLIAYHARCFTFGDRDDLGVQYDDLPTDQQGGFMFGDHYMAWRAAIWIGMAIGKGIGGPPSWLSIDIHPRISSPRVEKVDIVNHMLPSMSSSANLFIDNIRQCQIQSKQARSTTPLSSLCSERNDDRQQSK